MFNNDATAVPDQVNPAVVDDQLPNESEELIPASFPTEQEQTSYIPPSVPPLDPADNTTSNNGTDMSSLPPVASNTLADEDLINIKRRALGQLTPLIGHLDQSPEDKFKTTMMMIQASDDKSLLQSAYESALKITDEKFRAQALLDVVNEINYFTHLADTN